MRAWLEDRPQDAFGHHRYDPADFGWTYPGLAEEFRDYTEPYLLRPRSQARCGRASPIPAQSVELLAAHAEPAERPHARTSSSSLTPR